METTLRRKRHLTCDEVHRLLRIQPPATYQVFLKSKYWYDCKQKVLHRDEMQCRQCGCPNALEVHHLTYEHHRNELNHLDDLVTLCNACHAAEHGKPNQRRNGLESLGTIINRGYWLGGE